MPGVFCSADGHKAQSHGSNAEVPALSTSALCLTRAQPAGVEAGFSLLLTRPSSQSSASSALGTSWAQWHPVPRGLLECVGTVSVVAVLGMRMVAVVLFVPWLRKITVGISYRLAVPRSGALLTCVAAGCPGTRGPVLHQLLPCYVLLSQSLCFPVSHLYGQSHEHLVACFFAL